MEITSGQPNVMVGSGDMRMQGVVRYPAGYTFNAGPGPFAGAPLPPVPPIGF